MFWLLQSNCLFFYQSKLIFFSDVTTSGGVGGKGTNEHSIKCLVIQVEPFLDGANL